MKDFTKWVEAWNAYIHPPTKQVPRTAAELSAGGHSAWVIIAIMCIFTLAAVILHCLEERSTLSSYSAVYSPVSASSSSSLARWPSSC